MADIEKTTRYVTHVGTLPEAWEFIMAHLDRVGPAPSIRIDPTWVLLTRDSDDEERVFVVAVS
jgi:hypothetical protein